MAIVARPPLRAKTGIEGFDKMTEGGLLERSATLIEGAPGTGKTTFGLQFVYKGAILYNEPGIIVTFEEFPQDLYRDAANFGWDLRKLESDGKLYILFTSPESLLDELTQPDSTLSDAIHRIGARRILIDSMTLFQEMTQDAVELRRIFRTVVNALKRDGLTSIMTGESYGLIGDTQEQRNGLAFLADAVVLLRHVEIESSLQRAALILKMRGTRHVTDIRRYRITSNGVEIESTFKGREGIMSGSPRSLPSKMAELLG